MGASVIGASVAGGSVAGGAAVVAGPPHAESTSVAIARAAIELYQILFDIFFFSLFCFGS
jgi:hypothetical protein